MIERENCIIDPENQWDTAVWQLVAMIPCGTVASYGQVATMLGFPRRSRHVGAALKRTPATLDIPWYRVINSAGKISFSLETPQGAMQRQHLEAEGVVVSDQGKINIKRYRWDGN